MKSITYSFRSQLFGVFASAMVGLLLLTSVDNAKAQQLPAENSSNTELIKRAFNAWAAGTGGPYNLLADDAVWTITRNSLASKTYNNREAFMSEVLLPFHARMSERLEPKITRICNAKRQPPEAWRQLRFIK